MITLSYTNIQGEFPTATKRNNHIAIRYNSSNNSVEYTSTYKEPRKTRFTIRMLEDGKIKLALLPFLYICTEDDDDWGVKFKCVNGPHKGYIETFNLSSDEPNLIETIKYNKNDEIELYINWSSGPRTFGYYFYNYDDVSIEYYNEICSGLSSESKYEVFGNLGSLLFKENETMWMYTDLYNKYLSLGDSTFYGFFRNVSSISMEYETEDSLIVDGEFGDNKIINAYDLYIPKIYVYKAYSNLFRDAFYLEYGPKHIHSFLMANSSISYYCSSMFKNCNFKDDYVLFISTDYNLYNITSNNQEFNVGSMSMFENSHLGTIYYQCNYALASSVSNWNMLKNASYKNFVMMPGIISTSDVRFRLGLDAVSETQPQIQYKELRPIISITNLEKILDRGYTLENILYEPNLFSVEYVYMGTVWVQEKLRSYYLWKYIEPYDSVYFDITVNDIVPQYIFTAEKNFIGQTLVSSGKPLCHPIKLVSTTFQYQEYRYKPYPNANPGVVTECDYYDFEDYSSVYNKFIVVYSSEIIPEEDAGIPMIYIDDYDIDELDLNFSSLDDSVKHYPNYKYYRNIEYKLVDYDETAGDWIWEINKDTNIVHLIESPSGKQLSDIDLFSNPYVYTNTLDPWNFKSYENKQGTNDYLLVMNNDLNILYDTQSNNNQINHYFVLSTNEIGPNTSTFKIN